MDKIAQNQNLVHISRIQVPDFRALKNIDIAFETDLTPRIFPLGSLNGGGKSTLLQLLFVLLCFFRKSKNISFLVNMLEGFPADKILAKIDLLIGKENISLVFYSRPADGNFLRQLARKSPGFSDYMLSRSRQDNDELLLSNSFFVCNYKHNGLKEYMTLVCEIDPILHISQENSNDSNPKSVDISLWPQSVQQQQANFESDLLHKVDLIDIIRDKLSNSVFLAAPITQSFRFFDTSIRDLAFKTKSTSEYYKEIESARENLSNFFAYDTIAVDILIQAFLKVRDDDFRYAIDTGNYSNNYQKMLQDIEVILGDKKVNIDKDFKGITFFKEDVNGNSIKLYPEDLSHGELKRLSLFIWLKYNNIENSIVLIDEIEIALHPDWQYQIVRDLETWAPSNQYILATHSYELCHALTPAHVKEISPRLLKK